MIISDEQARAAAELLKQGPTGTPLTDIVVSEDILTRARDVIASAPETREERVAEAKARMVSGFPDSDEVAVKMISRIVSDAIR